jgi:hypothetical protein
MRFWTRHCAAVHGVPRRGESSAWHVKGIQRTQVSTRQSEAERGRASPGPARQRKGAKRNQSFRHGPAAAQLAVARLGAAGQGKPRVFYTQKEMT